MEMRHKKFKMRIKKHISDVKLNNKTAALVILFNTEFLQSKSQNSKQIYP